MSIFDDLIPRSQPQRSIFADLIPQDEESPRLPQMDTGVPTFGLGGPVEPERTSSVSRRDGRQPVMQDVEQSLSDFGRRAARGVTEVVAGVPEALGIMQSGGVEARIEDTQGGMGVRDEQIKSLQERLADPAISEDERRFREQQLADLMQGQEALQGNMQVLQERAAIPTQERPIFKAGDAIRERSTQVFGAPDPQFDDRFGSKLAEGAGSLLGFAATTALTGWIGGAATGAALNSASLYNEAIDSGASEQDARRAAAIGAAIGTTEVIPIGRALDRFTGKAKSRLSGAISRRLASALETAGEEGVQEAAVQIANNLTAAGIYDPNRQWSEGALESAAIGAVLGGGLGALTPAPANPPRARDDDAERLNSPRLTPADRASPLPNDIIDDGKAALEALVDNPQPPQAGVQPLDEAAPNVRLPEVDAVQRPLPTDRLSPTLGAAPERDVAPSQPNTPPQPEAAPQRRLSEPMEDVATPGRMVQIDLDTGETVDVAQAEAAPQPAPVADAPANPRLSEPMEDTQTGQTVQVDLETGETIPQRSADVTPQAVPEATDDAIPEMADPAPAVSVARPARERLKRRPLTDLLKAEGVQPGSPLAVELSARGIDQRTTPGLFKAGGRTDWDNLPVSEWSEFAPIVGDDGNGYLSRDGLIEAVENEMRGQPVQVGEQARLQEARDLREYAARFDDDTPPIDLSDIPEATITIPTVDEDISTDAERRQMVERSVDGMAQQAGLSDILTPAERREAANTLTANGGNVEDVLWGIVYRSADDVDTEDSYAAAQQRITQEDAQDGGVEAAPAVQQSVERPDSERGPEGGSAARVEDAGRADEREASAAESVDLPREPSGRKAASWVIRERDTGAVVMETTDPAKVRALNEDRFEAVAAGQHLAEINDPTSKAYAAARGENTERTEIAAPSEPATEQTDAGEQTLMPGVAPITERDRQRAEIERRQNSRMTGRDEGPGSGRDDLFGAPEDRRDLFDAAPEPATKSTLEDYAPKTNKRQQHIYAEFGGRRYYVASFDNVQDAERAAKTLSDQTPVSVGVYMTDRADSTSIDGDARDLTAVLFTDTDVAPMTAQAWSDMNRSDRVQTVLKTTLLNSSRPIESMVNAERDRIAATGWDDLSQAERAGIARALGNDKEARAIQSRLRSNFAATPTETPADMGKAAATAGDDRKPPADMSAEDTTAWLRAYDEQMAGQVLEAKRAALDEGGKPAAPGSPVDVVEYKPTKASPTLQEAEATARASMPVSTMKYQRAPAVDSKAFKDWFGDSKVVDGDGNPLVVYHGSNAEIDAFDPSKAQDNDGRRAALGYGRGKFYFSEEPSVARSYSIMRGADQPIVQEVYLRVEKPITGDEYEARYREVSGGREIYQGYDSDYDRFDRDMFIADLDEKLRAEGYDGIINDVGQIAVFSPTQIKSVNNRGTFDPSDPRIMYRRGATKSAIWPNLPELRAELDKMGLTSVDLRMVAPDPDYQAALEIDANGGMTVLIGASLDPEASVRHEAIHALKAMNLFGKGEWKILETRAQRDWMAKHDIEARYPELSPLEQIEEAIAEEYAAWDGKTQNGAFAKIKKFLEALGNMLRGQGFQTVDDVFGNVASGVVGRRPVPEGLRDMIQRGDAMLFQEGKRDGKGIRAYHGSPHDFDRFSMDAIGTGEGAQAYGHGLYFAENEAVARGYRDRISGAKWVDRNGLEVKTNDIVEDISKEARKAGFGVVEADEMAFNWRDYLSNPDTAPSPIKSVLKQKGIRLDGQGRMYEVNINANPDDFLDWDAPLSEQPRISALVPGSDGRGKDAINRLYNEASDPIHEAYRRGEIPLEQYQKTNPDALVTDRLREAGIPGIKYRDAGSRGMDGDSGTRNYVVFDENLIEVVRKYQRPNPNAQGREAIARGTNTPHIPDRQVFDEALRENATILARASGVKGATRDTLDDVRIAIQDRMLPLRRAEEAIAELTGGMIDKKDSAYFAEERYSGRVGFRLDAIRDEYVNPIARMIGKAGDKLKLTDPNGKELTGADAADLYVWARHAKERNARISTINPDLGGPTLEDPYATGTGSGMSDAQADAIIAQAEKSLERKTFRDIGAMTDRLGQEMIKWREDAGLLSKEEAAIWRAMYKHYVPLRGFAETDMHDAVANEVQIGSGGSKFGARGKESKLALGRGSQAYSPLATILSMAEEVTVRAEKNLVARTLYNLAEKYPAPAMWRVKSLETKRYFNSATGMVETRIVDPASVTPKPNEFAVKINGIEKRVELIDPKMADAMSQLGTMQMGAVTRFASMFSRLFSATNTMLSPPFIIVNAFRDMVTAQINLGQLPKELRGKVRKAALRDWVKSFGGSYSDMRGDGTSEYAQYFREFSAVGAKVSFWQIENPEARNDQLRKAIRRESGGVLNQMFWKNATFDTDVNPVLNWIETVNLAVDNATRLSVFVEARKQGMSVEEAASLSKNLTVNFNRRGEWGATMNAWFPFANAAVQGSHVLIKAMKAPQVQALLGGAVLTGFAMEFLNASLSEEDEDGELAHDKIPDYISQRNLIIPTGGESRVTIPLPYGYNVFFYAGQQMAKAMRGVKDEGQATRDVMKATFGAFSPISGEGLAQTLMPTLGDHMMELATNKDWLGRPIRPEAPFGDYGPQAYKMFKNEPPAPFQFASDMLNKGTGGNELEPGLIDVSPEYLHHTFKFLTGGAGRFVDQVTDIGIKVASGDADLVQAHQVPLLRTVRYQPSEFLDQGRYFEFRNSVNNARAMVDKRAPELGIDPRDELVKMAGLYPQLRAAERQRRAISEKIDDIYADRSLTYRERRERLEPLEKQRQDVYIRFNRAYVEAMGPQSE